MYHPRSSDFIKLPSTGIIWPCVSNTSTVHAPRLHGTFRFAVLPGLLYRSGPRNLRTSLHCANRPPRPVRTFVISFQRAILKENRHYSVYALYGCDRRVLYGNALLFLISLTTVLALLSREFHFIKPILVPKPFVGCWGFVSLNTNGMAMKLTWCLLGSATDLRLLHCPNCIRALALGHGLL